MATWSGQVEILDASGESLGRFEAHLFSESNTWGVSKWWGHLKLISPPLHRLDTAEYTMRLLQDGKDTDARATLSWNGSSYTVGGRRTPPF